MGVFWDAGFAGASLDALGAATGLNRPSLYLAFGDKRALYRAAMQRYTEGTLAALEKLLARRPLRAALEKAFARTIAFYLSGEGAARGCFLIGTALTEAVNDGEVREALLSDLRGADRILEARFAAARAEGDLPAGAPADAALAGVAAAVMHTFAVRARAGAPAVEVEAIAATAVELICGPADADQTAGASSNSKASPP